MDVVVGRSIRRTEATIRVGLTELSREASYANNANTSLSNQGP